MYVKGYKPEIYQSNGPFSHSRYAGAVTTPAAAAGAPFAALKGRFALHSVSFITTAATACSVGLIGALTAGTATTTVAGRLIGPSPGADGYASDAVASSSLIQSAWSAEPTIDSPALYFRKVTLPATAGCSVTWEFPEPLFFTDVAGTQLDPQPSVLLWNFGAGAGPVLVANFEFTEITGVG